MNSTYAVKIIDELAKAQPSFNWLCNAILEIQRLTELGAGGGKGKSKKEVQLANADSSSKRRFTGVCRICGTKCSLSLRECQR